MKQTLFDSDITKIINDWRASKKEDLSDEIINLSEKELDEVIEYTKAFKKLYSLKIISKTILGLIAGTITYAITGDATYIPSLTAIGSLLSLNDMNKGSFYEDVHKQLINYVKEVDPDYNLKIMIDNFNINFEGFENFLENKDSFDNNKIHAEYVMPNSKIHISS